MIVRYRRHRRVADARRDRRISLRVSPDEHATIAAAAARVGLTAAGFAAEVALAASLTAGAPAAVRTSVLAGLRTHLVLVYGALNVTRARLDEAGRDLDAAVIVDAAEAANEAAAIVRKRLS